jgi:sigma-B regulation protein RsbU (phosphoserine phosphatase)
MLMAVSRTSLKAKAMEGISPDACLAASNDTLAEDSLPHMFVTMFYGVIDTRNGNLEYSNGGHNLPYLLRRDGRVTELDNVGGMFLGFRKNEGYECETLVLEDGDSIFLFTDGVTEAFDANDEMFGEIRLRDCLSRVGNLPPDEIVEAVISEVELFSKDVPQADDITCLILRYNG